MSPSPVYNDDEMTIIMNVKNIKDGEVPKEDDKTTHWCNVDDDDQNKASPQLTKGSERDYTLCNPSPRPNVPDDHS